MFKDKTETLPIIAKKSSFFQKKKLILVILCSASVDPCRSIHCFTPDQQRDTVLSRYSYSKHYSDQK